MALTQNIIIMNSSAWPGCRREEGNGRSGRRDNPRPGLQESKLGGCGGLLIYFKSVLNYMAPGGVVAVASAKWHGTARPRPQPQHGAYLGATFDFRAARRATTNKFR